MQDGNLKILEIYGEAFKGEISSLTLHFNQMVNPSLFSEFYLTSIFPDYSYKYGKI